MEIRMRNEEEGDYRDVEELTRAAFWNLYLPGCDEHYLAHVLRGHPDFLKDLDFVVLEDGRIVGNIMYTKSWLLDEAGKMMDAITFGPVSVAPERQRRGLGSALIRHSLAAAKSGAHRVVVIQGYPHNYCKHGFKSAKDFGLSDSAGRFPYGLLALELEDGALRGHRWTYRGSEAYEIDMAAAAEFDKLFEARKKEYRHSQEEFSIACRAYLD
jgi:putative acetyltransferase